MTGYSFACKDLGMSCAFELKGASSKDEVMRIAQLHAASTHKMTEVSPELAGKIAGAIHG
jgi:predicted small metal-binding protein